MSLLQQRALGTNAVAVAHDQQANLKFRINRRTPDRALRVGVIAAQFAKVEESIKVAQKVVGRDVVFNVKRQIQSLLSAQ